MSTSTICKTIYRASENPDVFAGIGTRLLQDLRSAWGAFFVVFTSVRTRFYHSQNDLQAAHGTYKISVFAIGKRFSLENSKIQQVNSNCVVYSPPQAENFVISNL